MKSVAVYTAGRFLILVVVAGLLWLIGMRGFLLLVATLLISMPAAYVLLARQRVAMTAEVERTVNDRRGRKESLRSQLRGDDSPPGDDQPRGDDHK